MYGILARSENGATTRLEDVRFRAANRPLAESLEDWLFHEFRGRIALASSFGTESAVLLHLVSKVDRTVPVLFADTGKLFPETLAYRALLADRLRLTNVQLVAPKEDVLRREDPRGDLWSKSTDACCAIRKVQPYQDAINQFDALITGRKRHHGAGRSDIGLVDVANGRFRLNPLFDWSSEKIDAYMENFGLPRHPLTAHGYTSVGCAHCTAKPTDGGARSGRWNGSSKTECGIHLSTGWVSLRS